jgi:hypothetical protein
MLKPTGIVRPRVALQQLKSVTSDGLRMRVHSFLSGVPLDELKDKGFDVGWALSQRCQTDNLLEAPDEIIPESAMLRLLFNVTVRRCDYADVQNLCFIGALGTDGIVLNKPQEAGLYSEWKLSKFVKE